MISFIIPNASILSVKNIVKIVSWHITQVYHGQFTSFLSHKIIPNRVGAGFNLPATSVPLISDLALLSEAQTLTKFAVASYGAMLGEGSAG